MQMPGHDWLTAAIALAGLALQLPAAEPQSGRDLHARLVASCAWVVAGSEGRGTGWLVDADKRWVATNFHVVGDARTVDVSFPVWRDGKLINERDEYIANQRLWRFEGKVLRRDPDCDLALIELSSLPKTARALPLSSAPASAGAWVH